MNFLLCILNHASKNFLAFLLYLVIALIINFNILGIMCDMELKKRHVRQMNTEPVKTHQCKYIEDFALRANCELWSCWESQLRDNTRVEFLDIYNKFRSLVVRQECVKCQYYDDIAPMIQLEWHWKLEKESQNAIKNCPYQEFKKNLKLDLNDGSSNGTNSLECEMVSSSFPIQGGSQTELIQILPFLLYSNHLRDFDNVGKYRRSLALYMGCSYIPRVLSSEQMHSANPKLKKSVGHLLCYFCTKEKKFQSNALSSCPMYTTRTEINDFPLLCKLITNEITMPCETTIVPCPIWKKSYSWFLPSVRNIEAQFEYETEELYDDELPSKLNLTLTPDSKQPKSNVSRPPIKKVYITPKAIIVDPYDTKFCIIIILMYVFIILLMVSTILLVCYFHLVNRQRVVYT